MFNRAMHMKRLYLLDFATIPDHAMPCRAIQYQFILSSHHHKVYPSTNGTW